MIGKGDLVSVHSRFDNMLGVVLCTKERTSASKTFAKVLWVDGTATDWNVTCLEKVSENRRLG